MALDDNTEDDNEVLPAMSPADRLTYDPTQGTGTPGWQAAVKAQMEYNSAQRRN